MHGLDWVCVGLLVLQSIAQRLAGRLHDMTSRETKRSGSTAAQQRLAYTKKVATRTDIMKDTVRRCHTAGDVFAVSSAIEAVAQACGFCDSLGVLADS
jgi:hypothetical protein